MISLIILFSAFLVSIFIATLSSIGIIIDSSCTRDRAFAVVILIICILCFSLLIPNCSHYLTFFNHIKEDNRFIEMYNEYNTGQFLNEK